MPSKKAEQAFRYFSEGLLCSQSILLTYGPEFGIDEDMAVKVARPFGSGISRMCETCGAVTGAYMVLGLSCQEEDEKNAKEKTYELCREFAKRFVETNGSTNCQQLLQCDLGTSEGQNRFRQENLIHLCNNYVKSSAGILEDLLQRSTQERS